MMMTLLTCMTCSVSADASGKSRKSMAGIDMIAAGGKKDLRFSFGHAAKIMTQLLLKLFLLKNS